MVAGAVKGSMEELMAPENEIAVFKEMVKLTVQSVVLQRVKFNALVNEGFTEAQALELCKDLNPYKK